MSCYFKKVCSWLCLVALFSSTAMASGQGQQQSIVSKEFVTACTYGVLAGSLVGISTLAFEDDPSNSLQNVAKGASIGLYTGILLGVYIVYIVPIQIKREKLNIYEREVLSPPPGAGINRFRLFPLISRNGLEGAVAFWEVMNF